MGDGGVELCEMRSSPFSGGWGLESVFSDFGWATWWTLGQLGTIRK